VRPERRQRKARERLHFCRQLARRLVDEYLAGRERTDFGVQEQRLAHAITAELLKRTRLP
jgi:hypothetical protein